MNKITQVLLAVSLVLISTATLSIEVKTPATALTQCKAEAKLVHPTSTKITHKKIKQMRGKFRVYLKISTPKGKINTLCEITRDGEITYSAT